MVKSDYKTGKKSKRHEYDLELKSLLENYKSNIRKVELEGTEKNPEYFIGLIKFVLDEYCKSREIDFEKAIQIVVTFEDYYPYKSLLALSLIFYDSHSIRQYLNYHEEEFIGRIDIKESFIGIIEFEVVKIVKYSSPFDNLSRLFEIMKWVEDKRAAYKLIRVEETDGGQNNFKKPLLDWNEKKKLLLLGFSKELFKRGYTENPLDFQDLFFFGKVVVWKENIESWVYLFYRLTNSPCSYITSIQGKKPYYSFANEYFNFCNYTDEISKKWNFRSMSYNVRNPNIKKHLKAKLGIDSLLFDILGEPVPSMPFA